MVESMMKYRDLYERQAWEEKQKAKQGGKKKKFKPIAEQAASPNPANEEFQFQSFLCR